MTDLHARLVAAHYRNHVLHARLGQMKCRVFVALIYPDTPEGKASR